MPEALSEKQLTAILSQQIGLAKFDRKQGGRDASREKALDYYFGNMDPYVPPEPNRSRVVSTDVRDVVNWLMPQLLRVFTSARSMFVAEPREEGDIQYANDVTDGLNYIFWDENNGYETVHSGTWDSLVHGDAIIKTFYDETPVYSAPRFHENLTEDERAFLAGDDSVDVLAQTKRTVSGVGLDGQPTDETRYDIKLRTRKANGRYVVTVIPPEDFLVSGGATSLEEAAFKDHWERTKTRSDLIAMGYDKDKVMSIPTASRAETAEQQARSQYAIDDDATDKSMEQVDYHEAFVMVDADGDGVAEMIRVCAGGANGEVLLDWEVWEDEDPFDNIRCKPIPHRWDSGSVADDEIEIQDVKTVLKRQFLNNTYWVNNPQRFAKGKISNPDQLDNPTFGGTVFGDANSEVVPLPVAYIGDKALEGIHYMDEETAKRTGVNAQSMALDPETLQNQSATANQNATDASRSQPEMIARNMAEGWAKVGRKLLRLMARHEDGPRTIMSKGKPRPIDPASWNPDMHVKVNTGLGTGSRDRDAAMLNTVLNQQILFTDRIGQVFPEKALDMLPYIHNTLTKFAESTGLQNPEMYWPEINPDEIEQGKQVLAQRANQPPPEVMLEQMRQQGAQALEQTKGQTTLQVEQGKAQVAQHQAELQAQGEVVKNQAELDADLQTKAADRQNAIDIANVNAALALQQQEREIQFKMWDAEQNRALEREKMAHQAMVAEANNAARAEMAANKPQPTGK
jgi:hypothetical protein